MHDEPMLIFGTIVVAWGVSPVDDNRSSKIDMFLVELGLTITDMGPGEKPPFSLKYAEYTEVKTKVAPTAMTPEWNRAH